MSRHIIITHRLIHATRCGNLKKVKSIVNHYGLSYSKAWGGGYLLLRDAIKKNYTNIAELLLLKGSKVNIKSEYCTTPLHFAVRKRNVKIAKMLLDRGANIDSPDMFGNSPLHYAVANKVNASNNLTGFNCGSDGGNKGIVKLLLERGANVDLQNMAGKTVLHLAVESGNLMMISQILIRGPDVNIISNKQSLNTAVLRLGKRYPAIVNMLLEYGICSDFKDIHDYALICTAVQKGYTRFVEGLLNRGANVNMHYLPYDATLLYNAIQENQLEMVKLLLAYNADVNIVHGGNETVLHVAAREGQDEICKMLINKGASINAKQENGETALHIATRKGFIKTVEIFLQYGAQFESKCNLGLTPLHLAAQEGHLAIVKTLSIIGADVNLRDKLGRTPLHVAAKEGQLLVVLNLLESGSDINIITNKNRTPLASLADSINFFFKYNSDSDDRELSDSDDYENILNNNCCNKMNIRVYSDIGVILKEDIVKKKVANLYVCERNLDLVECSEQCLFYRKCRLEIEQLRNARINNICLYDILTATMRYLIIYARDETVTRKLESRYYKRQFPIYINMIINNLKRGQRRGKTVKCLNALSGFTLPHLVIEQIFSFLSNSDLANLTQACENVDISNVETSYVM